MERQSWHQRLEAIGTLSATHGVDVTTQFTFNRAIGYVKEKAPFAGALGIAVQGTLSNESQLLRPGLPALYCVLARQRTSDWQREESAATI